MKHEVKVTMNLSIFGSWEVKRESYRYSLKVGRILYLKEPNIPTSGVRSLPFSRSKHNIFLLLLPT
jgi:hypothetical protein